MLEQRAKTAREICTARGVQSQIEKLSDAVAAKSQVCVSMPASVARDLALDPRKIFVNYEKLVGAGIRRPALAENDRRRAAVAGFLFGSYADEIRYGTLTIGLQPLPSYGDIVCLLRTVTIQDRVSFLEDNSYAFAKRHGIKLLDSIPKGYRAVWDNRHLLAVAKLGDKVQKDWDGPKLLGCLVTADSHDRNKDEFIEAHIYGGFDIGAIEEMARTTAKIASKEVAIDVDIALEKFQTS